MHIPASHADDAESPLELRPIHHRAYPLASIPSASRCSRVAPLWDRCQFMATPLMRLPIPTIHAVHSVGCLVDPPPRGLVVPVP